MPHLRFWQCYYRRNHSEDIILFCLGLGYTHATYHNLSEFEPNTPPPYIPSLWRRSDGVPGFTSLPGAALRKAGSFLTGLHIVGSYCPGRSSSHVRLNIPFFILRQFQHHSSSNGFIIVVVFFTTFMLCRLFFCTNSCHRPTILSESN